jgi:TonB family protein
MGRFSIPPTIVFVCIFGALLFARDQPTAMSTKLFPPVYPPLAHQAHIAGEVHLRLHLRRDGTVDSVEIIDGHPMLRQAAVDSAEKSQFDCGGCDETTFVYAYEIRDGCHFGPHCTRLDSDELLVTRSAGRVVVSGPPYCICDPAISRIAIRSAKCLYLWKCGHRDTLDE